MLEGLEISEVHLSDLENERTVGAEYYSPFYLEPFRKLISSRMEVRLLSSCCSLITDGDHGSADYVESGVTFVLSEAVKNGWIDKGSCRQISEPHAKTLKRSVLKKRDVLITKTGIYFGKSAVVTNEFAGANTIAHVGLLRVKRDINPYYLSTFFNCTYGYSQLRRRGIKATRPEIKLIEFQDITVVLPSHNFQNEIEKIIVHSQKLLNESKSQLAVADDLLLRNIGLEKFLPDRRSLSIKSFKSSFAVTGRLDAEHYQTKYEELYKALAKKNHIFKLGDCLSFNQRGTQPDYAQEGLPVVNSKHVQRGHVNMIDNRFAAVSDNTNAAVIKQGDVLMNGTGVGTIGRAAPYLHAADALPDNHVTVLRTEALSPICLALYLNSIAGQYQVDQHFKGSSGQIELYPTDIANFWCPELDQSTQQSIDNLAQQSFTLKAKSERLLEAAKRAVEIAIEQDETAGMAYLAREEAST